jgi:hypothetical protein
MAIEKNYEELADMIRGDSPNWTHEEIVERFQECCDALWSLEDPQAYIEWFEENGTFKNKWLYKMAKEKSNE